MHVLKSLGHKNFQLLLGMRSSNKHLIILKWGIFNVSVLLNEHGHPPFLFQNLSSHRINIQWTKFERKSIVTFISEELP